LNNGHFTRQGQHNNRNNRNRNRNRRHSSGGSGHTSSGGGNNGNRVLDSNGPDVKLRGTAQTIAEKYMQLGRDAQLSGDNVMAESYYQHGEHYYRLWLAAQPAGQPIQFSRQSSEDELDGDQADGVDGEDESTAEAPMRGNEANEAPISAEESDGQGQAGDPQSRPLRNRDQNRDVPRDRPRNNRWPRRNDRNFEANGETQERVQPPVNAVEESEVPTGNWETPSFLTRAIPAVVSEVVSEVEAEQPVRKPRREFRPRRPREAPVPVDDAGPTDPAE
jgi:Domain of unknown function (DUF4167)